MGLLVKGQWQDLWYDTQSSRGQFLREPSQFRNWVTADGSAGPSGNGGFKAEAGRYHLYISHACPWAHRTLIFRQLKGLSDLVDVSVVSPDMAEHGWTFDSSTGSTGDALYSLVYFYQLYLKSQQDYSGRVTVPVLWDKKTQCIVNNESSEIIRMFNSAFNHLTGNQQDYYPKTLHKEIDEINQWIYDTINNGVYLTGFATTQQAYESAWHDLFYSLDRVEAILTKRRYLTGTQITEADWRLFVTLIRFDAVYVGHFKCNKKRIADYPNISNYVRELYQLPGIKPTVNVSHIKQHYYASHKQINPTGIVPLGPEQDFDFPHNRMRV